MKKQNLIDAMITFNNRPANVTPEGKNREWAHWQTLHKVDGEWLVEFRTADQTFETREIRTLAPTLKTSLTVINTWGKAIQMIFVKGIATPKVTPGAQLRTRINYIIGTMTNIKESQPAIGEQARLTRIRRLEEAKREINELLTICIDRERTGSYS